ncbi:hypothetical protein BZA05DRAFT_390352 [Tricharina praecox]|uniref:uncharacterized protein n=1 Tax=Tricharina praecox TaxID=43433 RepID=UPI00221EF0D7|nr:uncharacterized protein BZA05DRAFT_390352 [Tricharina praecox]KAI5856016.1 hypothetical protein BZA05DRAFT_390352 [Tricharina praecox]
MHRSGNKGEVGLAAGEFFSSIFSWICMRIIASVSVFSRPVPSRILRWFHPLLCGVWGSLQVLSYAFLVCFFLSLCPAFLSFSCLEGFLS